MQRSAWIRQGRNIWQWPDKPLRLINAERAADATVVVRETKGGGQLKGENIELKSPKENDTAMKRIGGGNNGTGD